MMPKAISGHPRHASHSHAARPHATPPKRPSTAKPSPRKATEEEVLRAGIPAGYSRKNWVPIKEPIILLGSVFDANSLGKWIYDWTVYNYRLATPMSVVAGDLWLLLIQLAGKVKRADARCPGQPQSYGISQEQFAAEVKSVYTGLMMVETKCIHVDNPGRPSSNQNAEGGGTHTQSVFEDHWQALIFLHRTLLHEHHDFLLAAHHSRLAISPIDAFYTKMHGMKNQLERSPRKPPSLIRRLDGLM